MVGTPEAEQPPSLPQIKLSEEHVAIMESSKPGEPKTDVPEENGAGTNGNVPAPVQTPAHATPHSSPSLAPGPKRRSELNGSICSTPERSSPRSSTEMSPYINGGFDNSRLSYSGSMASESIDMSFNKDIISRVRPH